MRTGDEVRRQQVVDDARMADQHDHGPRRDGVVPRHLEPHAEQRPHCPEQSAGPQLLQTPGHVGQPRSTAAPQARDPHRRQRGETPDLGCEVHPQEQDEPRGGRRNAKGDPAHPIDQ